MAQNPLDSQLARLARKIQPRCELLRTWPLKGGISAGMTAFEIQLPGGETRRYILRRPGAASLTQNPSPGRAGFIPAAPQPGETPQNPSLAEKEFRLLRFLQSPGLPAPVPILFDPSGEIFPTPFLVIEYVEGGMDFSLSGVEDRVPQMAALLARIHRVDVTQADLSFLPLQPTGLPEIIGERPARMEDTLAEARIREALEAAWPPARPNPPVLLHGDYWPGNLLWKDGRLAAVIDWEDALLGDPLSDLAISRLDLCWILGIEAMHAFTRHYLSLTALDPSALPCWDLVAALRLARLAGDDLTGWAAYFHPYRREDITEVSIREQYRYFIELAFRHLGRNPFR